eukprot:TRINITY_DN2028_c1_g1_i9.p1 TRINITY_DN2028_c1_g1~~TRINITY_DN2028_c1_g1_i9.p1  ORF type:complete len:606 (-),score=83.45 TRINITY_DN2028_c1_g1_i9:65-1828(-)
MANEVHLFSFVLGGISLAVHVAFALRFAILQLRNAHATWCAPAMLAFPRIRACAEALMARIRGKVEEPDLLLETIEANMILRRDRFVCLAIPYFTNSAALCYVSMSWNTFLVPSVRWMSKQQDVILVLYFVVLVTWQRLPRATQIRGSMFILNFTLLANLMFVVWATPSRYVYAFSTGLGLVPRMLASAALLKRTPIIFWNIMHLVLVSIISARSETDSTCLSSEISSISSVEIIAAAVVAAVADMSRRMVFRIINEEILGSETKSGKHAAVALLNSVCDAAVELNEQLVITTDGPRLRAMLLHGSSRSLTGIEFVKFIPAEMDRETFVQHASGLANGLRQENELADLFHINLRDSTNNELKVEIYMVPFTSFDCTKFLIGIREKIVDDVVAPQCVPAEVSFDASTFEVLSHSSSFDLRTCGRSCESGDCLRRWMVSCEKNDAFLCDVGMAANAVRDSKESFSFETVVQLKDLVKPGTAYVPGSFFSVDCSVRADTPSTSTDDRFADREVDGVVTADAKNVLSQPRVVMTMSLARIARLRAGKCKRKPGKKRNFSSSDSGSDSGSSDGSSTPPSLLHDEPRGNRASL